MVAGEKHTMRQLSIRVGKHMTDCRECCRRCPGASVYHWPSRRGPEGWPSGTSWDRDGWHGPQGQAGTETGGMGLRDKLGQRRVAWASGTSWDRDGWHGPQGQAGTETGGMNLREKLGGRRDGAINGTIGE